MSTNELLDWIIHETNGLTEGRMTGIPELVTLQKLTDDKNCKIWKYVTKYVKAKQSVKSIKKILKIKHAQSKQQKSTNERHESIYNLREEITKAEEKIMFEETSLKSITKDILYLKHRIEEIKRNNCNMLQNCSFFHITILKFQERNLFLRNILEKLTLLINKTFDFEKYQHFQDLVMIHSLENSKHHLDLKFIEKRVNHMIFQMSSAVENELSEQDKKNCTISSLTLINEIMNNISVIEFINVLKKSTTQSESLLKESKFQMINTKNSIEQQTKPYEKYLQVMKLDLVDSSFNRKRIINDTNSLKPNDKTLLNVISNSDDVKIIQKILKLKIQNQRLKDSIECLEKTLSYEHEITKYLMEKNNETRYQCKTLKEIMLEFHNKIQIILNFQRTTQKNFNDITKTLISANAYLYNFTMTNESENYFSSIKDEIHNDYEFSLSVLKCKHFLKSLICIPVLERNMMPSEMWNLLNIQNFQNCSLIVNKLTNIKVYLLNQDTKLLWNTDKSEIEIFHTLLNNIKSKFKELKQVEEKFETVSRKSYENLKISLEEWWEQKAQFIPCIEYDGKSLKMWLDILLILKD